MIDKPTIRTSLDIPRELHRRLHEKAARTGCSARQLILRSRERELEVPEPRRHRKRLPLEPPLIPSTGKPFDLTNEQIYELIEFP